jgi:hypothetical protein
MNYCERIPAKTENISLDGKNVKIDTEGLEATVAATGGTVYIKAVSECADADAFALEKGGCITLNGCFYLSGNGAAASVLYCRII